MPTNGELRNNERRSKGCALRIVEDEMDSATQANDQIYRIALEQEYDRLKDKPISQFIGTTKFGKSEGEFAIVKAKRAAADKRESQ